MAGLYLHIPFCRSKCPYCDFFSTVETDTELDAYPELLTRQLSLAVNDGSPGLVETIYFGGGTPSLLAPEAIAGLLQSIDAQLGIAPGAEITLEANPGTINLKRLSGYRAAGVNRLSLGLQTLTAEQLQRLGRLHSLQEGRAAVALAYQAGFDNLSLDLMFALPGQTLPDLRRELDAYLALGPEHLSCYGLTAEPGTPFHAQVASGAISLPEDDFYAEAFLTIHEQLGANGYRHYEIANYAQDGFACRHNLGYWQRRPYLGLGAGAHSFTARGWGHRSAVPNDLAAYREALGHGRDPAERLEAFDRKSALSETVYLALRTRQGLCDKTLQQQFGCTLEEAFPQAVAQLEPWLLHHDARWSLTPAGWLLYDRLIQAFL